MYICNSAAKERKGRHESKRREYCARIGTRKKKTIDAPFYRNHTYTRGNFQVALAPHSLQQALPAATTT
jgi:hypothetical protein